MIVVKQLLNHCSSAFGCHAELYQSQEADVLIAVFPPTKRRGWWTYVTLELYRVGASECLMYSYKFERDMITLLAHVADQVMRNGENRLHYRLQPGEVFPLESPVQEASCLDHVIVTPADYEEDGFDYFTNGAEVISFMMLHAIAESEAMFARRHGLDALEELFACADVDSLDFMRTPAI
ncbi:suppressor of fused domain protein [Brevibacillus choshinensis]|uniref:Suppressor of fused domain protein n=1 Tax=Brevibacillus choshinensis TaxID=54911 RepID=A0ABX7FLF1_BRECH|nr:suppressor of fused domain protein [Brevibacillus choshinensis]QRG66911.1 suppressor of fused domain protein [Brevibacillus choshinensis]